MKIFVNKIPLPNSMALQTLDHMALRRRDMDMIV